MIQTIIHWLTAPMERKKLLRFCLVFGLAVGLLAHAFMFVNKMPNHDDLEYYSDLKDAGFGAGRFFLVVFWKLFSNLSTPWLNGVLGVFFMSWAAFFLCDAYGWKQGWQAVAAGLILQLYPANISIYCYMYEAHVLLLGITIACMAPWLMKRGGKLRLVWTAGAVWMATGVYQSNVMLAIGLMILYVIRSVVQKEWPTTRQLWLEAIQCAAAAVVGLLVYMITLKAIPMVLGVALNEYQGMNQAGSLNLALIPQKIVQAYRMVWDEYVANVPDYVNFRMTIVRTPLVLAGVLGLAAAAVWALARKKPMQAVLLVLCGVLLPIACCGILFMGDDIEYLHMITLYPMILMLLLPLITIEPQGFPKGWCKRGVALVLAVLTMAYGMNGVVLANQAYLRLHQSYTKAEHFWQRVAGRIEELEGYRPKIRLKTIGFLDKDESLISFDWETTIRFWPFVGIPMEIDYTWPYCAANFLNKMIGLPVSDAQGWEPETPEGKAQLAAMPLYPKEGSVAIVEDVCVVKFVEWSAAE